MEGYLGLCHKDGCRRVLSLYSQGQYTIPEAGPRSETEEEVRTFSACMGPKEAQ
jgi:hypothetical protein